MKSVLLLLYSKLVAFSRFWSTPSCLSLSALFIRNPSLPHLAHLLAPIFFHMWSGYFKLHHFPLCNQPRSFSFCFQAYPVILEMLLFDIITLFTYRSHFDSKYLECMFFSRYLPYVFARLTLNWFCLRPHK